MQNMRSARMTPGLSIQRRAKAQVSGRAVGAIGMMTTCPRALMAGSAGAAGSALPRGWTAAEPIQASADYPKWPGKNQNLTYGSGILVFAGLRPVTCGWLVHKTVDNWCAVRINDRFLWTSCG
jgi:hypothetical protein